MSFDQVCDSFLSPAQLQISDLESQLAFICLPVPPEIS